MTVSSTTGTALLRPEDVGELLIKPTQRASVAMQAATVVNTMSSTYRIPIVSTDPTTAWTNEGDEIALTDPSIQELKITPAKLAGLVAVTAELSMDSSPEASEAVGQGLARDLAKKVDRSFFGAALPAPAPAGLPSAVGVGEVTGGPANVDWAAEAISNAQVVGAELSNFVASPATALALANLKDEDGSNRPLLGTDPSAPTRRTVQGLPILVSEFVEDGIVWGIPQDRVTVVVRNDAEIETSRDALFTSHRLAVRAIMRVSWGFPHPEAVQKISLTGGVEGASTTTATATRTTTAKK